MLRRAAVLLLLPLAAGLAGGSSARAATAQETGGGFSAVPSSHSPSDVHGTYFRLHADQGAVRSETLLVRNLSDEPKHLLLDAVDGLTGTTSGTVYANRDVLKHRAGKWLTPSATSLDLAPHATARVPFTVRVPAVARPGDHVAGLALQDAHRAHADSRFAITEIVRVVVGVQIVVDGPAAPKLALGKATLAPLPGTKVPSVVVALSNPGTKLCKPVLRATLARGAEQLTPVTRTLDTVLPGTSVQYPLPWPKALAAGDYAVRVRASGCGPDVSTTATAHLASALHGTPAKPDAPAQPQVVVRETAAALPVWAIAAGLAGALGLGILATLAVQRRGRRRHLPYAG